MGDRSSPGVDVGQRCHIQRPAERVGNPLTSLIEQSAHMVLFSLGRTLSRRSRNTSSAFRQTRVRLHLMTSMCSLPSTRKAMSGWTQMHPSHLSAVPIPLLPLLPVLPRSSHQMPRRPARRVTPTMVLTRPQAFLECPTLLGQGPISPCYHSAIT